MLIETILLLIDDEGNWNYKVKRKEGNFLFTPHWAWHPFKLSVPATLSPFQTMSMFLWTGYTEVNYTTVLPKFFGHSVKTYDG